MLVSEFSYSLPEELIAKMPLADRAASRLLHVERKSGKLRDAKFSEFPELLRPDDLIVFNNTRVFPARLLGTAIRKVSDSRPTGTRDSERRVEALLTSPVSPAVNGNSIQWNCLVRPGRYIKVGDQLSFGQNHELTAEVTAAGNFGERTVRFRFAEDFYGLIERLGHVPLPPYLKRPANAEDRERYQTIYARERGSVAAPTAGLHFTRAILDRIAEREIESTEITLHVGLGTFQPVREEQVENHSLHAEAYTISPPAAAAINSALDQGRRVVAVGTTTVRTLEHAAGESGRVGAGDGRADIFIYPGYKFRAVSALLTNFHLPKSTLLMLVCAFAGTQRTLEAYRHAVDQRYRFYSFGDCMFIE
ncbi:MAG: tRNA preQ1(34) S-adenosylmethionine ribosyltransferase-isomerase QueA [Acidobacteriales bacterium]|nr:tRNA preQ1(34) S-adenosylmethionine ribosyltransferase-isomerase QueA [Terriglobales bacterium]